MCFWHSASFPEQCNQVYFCSHYAKDRENIVTTDARKTGAGIPLWRKQSDGETKPIAFGSRYVKEIERKYLIEELELLAEVWGLEKFRFYLYGQKLGSYMDYQELEPVIERNRCNRQYSAKLAIAGPFGTF